MTLGNPEQWEPITQFHCTYHCDVCLHQDGSGPKYALKEERIRTRNSTKDFNLRLGTKRRLLLSPHFSLAHYKSAVALKGAVAGTNKLHVLSFNPDSRLSFSLFHLSQLYGGVRPHIWWRSAGWRIYHHSNTAVDLGGDVRHGHSGAETRGPGSKRRPSMTVRRRTVGVNAEPKPAADGGSGAVPPNRQRKDDHGPRRRAHKAERRRRSSRCSNRWPAEKNGR